MNLAPSHEQTQVVLLPLNAFDKNYAENLQKSYLQSDFKNNLNILQTNYVNLQILEREREKIQIQLQSHKAFLWRQLPFVKSNSEKAAFLDLMQNLNSLEIENWKNIGDWSMIRRSLEETFLNLQSNFYAKLDANLILIPKIDQFDLNLATAANSSEASNGLGSQFNLLVDNFPNLIKTYPSLNTINSYLTPTTYGVEKAFSLDGNMLNSNSTQTSNRSIQEEETSKTPNQERKSSNITSITEKNKFKKEKKEIPKATAAQEKNPLFQKQFDIACQIYPKKTIGSKTWEERIKYILKFKLKKIERNRKRKISKKFEGRSKEAIKKLRFKGRFVKDLNKKKNVFKIKSN